MSYRLQSRAFEHLVPSGLSRPPFFWQLWSHTHKPHLLFCFNVYDFSCKGFFLFSVNCLWVYDQTRNKETFVVTRPKPPYGRQGLAGSWCKDTARRVHVGVFSSSHFAPTGSARIGECSFFFVRTTFLSLIGGSHEKVLITGGPNWPFRCLDAAFPIIKLNELKNSLATWTRWTFLVARPSAIGRVKVLGVQRVAVAMIPLIPEFQFSMLVKRFFFFHEELCERELQEPVPKILKASLFLQ